MPAGTIGAIVTSVDIEGEVAPEHAITRVKIRPQGINVEDSINLTPKEMRELVAHYKLDTYCQLKDHFVQAVYHNGRLTRLEPPSRDWAG